MTLSEEMRRLSQGFLKAHNDRAEAVSNTRAAVEGLRAVTAEERARNRAGRQAMAAQQGEHMGQYIGELRQRVGDLGQNTAAFLKQLESERQAMSKTQRNTLAAEMSALCDNVSEIKEDAAAFLQQTGAAHQMMSEELQRMLASGMSALHGSVSEIKGDAAVFMQQTGAAHEAMGKQQRQALAAQRKQLSRKVSQMRGRMLAERNQVRADQREAGQVWGKLYLLMQERRSRARVAAMPSAVVVEKAARAGKEAPDDLSTIKGIGPGMRGRLSEAGIHTFAQLAGKTPDELREILGTIGRVAKVEDWIAKARELSR